MRIVSSHQIRQTVAQLCVQANKQLPEDIVKAMETARRKELWPLAKDTLDRLYENIEAARTMDLPVCQDTGMACVYVGLGDQVRVNGDLLAAINEGVAQGYGQGLLRKSVVCDPLRRVNTGDNSPAMVSLELIEGEQIKITVLPKGFGSENKSRLAMLKPSDGEEGVRRFLLDTVKAAGPDPCPPIVIGLGIGGTFDKVAAISKKALLRPIDQPNPDPFYAALEKSLLDDVNSLGIGPQGFGGGFTALGLNIETLPTHVAGLPVAVNISCHVTRRASAWV